MKKFKINENDNEPEREEVPGRTKNGYNNNNRVGTHLPFAVEVLTRPHLSVSETKDISEPNPIAQYRHWASHLRSRFQEIVRFLRRDS